LVAFFYRFSAARRARNAALVPGLLRFANPARSKISARIADLAHSKNRTRIADLARSKNQRARSPRTLRSLQTKGV
jgi:hypothetical protein